MENSVVIAITEKNGRFLMIERKQPEGSLLWTFPSGKIEAGETALSAAERETFEETGIVCKAFASLGCRQHPATGRDVHYIDCAYTDGEPAIRPQEADKIAAVAWCTPEQIKDRVKTDIFPAIRQRLGLNT